MELFKRQFELIFKEFRDMAANLYDVGCRIDRDVILELVFS